MKLKKYSYLLAFILMLVIGINGVDAKVNKECFYVSPDLKAKAKLQIKNGAGEWKYGEEKEHSLVHINQMNKKIRPVYLLLTRDSYSLKVRGW